MTSHRRSRGGRAAAVCAVIALGALWVADAGPARAQDDKEEAAQRAREACRELLREEGFEDIDLDDMRRRDEGATIVFEVTAESERDERELRCVYDRDEEEAQLDND